MTMDDHRRAFLTFVAGLLGDLDRYLEAGDVDPARDGVGYRQQALYLTDEELTRARHRPALRGQEAAPCPPA